MSELNGPLGALAFSLIGFGIAQIVVTIGAGFSERSHAIERDRILQRILPDAENVIAQVYVLIPALNEERVIGATVAAAIEADPGLHVVVIDDGSDDNTAEIVRTFDSERVSLVSRVAPNARNGKGEALNHGLSFLIEHASQREIDFDDVLLVVMDADGRLSPGAVPYVQRLFSDPELGGVQLPVRIRNTGSVLTDYQDFEFWGLSAIQQLARGRTHTVSLGGNGQFTRLRALVDLTSEPWSSSLTEDLDLAVSLLADGWRIASTPNAFVSQQALQEVRPLIRQRIRWMQGHLLSAGRLREVHTSTLPASAVLEITNYLMVPLVMILPWSLIFNLTLLTMWSSFSSLPEIPLFGQPTLGTAALVGFFVASSFFPHLMAAMIYRSRRPRLSFARVLGLGLGFVIYNYVTFVATWVALWRIVRGEHGWTKTERSIEPLPA